MSDLKPGTVVLPPAPGERFLDDQGAVWVVAEGGAYLESGGPDGFVTNGGIVAAGIRLVRRLDWLA